MKGTIHILLILSSMLLSSTSFAYINTKPNDKKTENQTQSQNQIEFRSNCDPAVEQTDQSINNVRARLLTGGDVWWDGSSNGRYVVPKVPAGQLEVSSIFAGAVWLGGVDPAGNLKLAAQTYGRGSGNFDFWPGPLNPGDGGDEAVTGSTDQETCSQWDRFFKVLGEEIDEHIRNFTASINEDKPYSPNQIPRNVRGWPGRGNPFFFDVHGFELPNTTQGLAGFFDADGDTVYDPSQGDYPIIEIRGCPEPQYPDEMIFWIYNDNGNVHAQSQGDPIQMEVQVQAFGYATNDQINDMTFQRYKLINRAIESIDSTYFAMWVDADLGCAFDDYVGCDTLRSLAIIYNSDGVDGQSGTDCAGTPTYGFNIPILGVDYFRGPLDENFQELGMSSFTYYNNGGVGGAPPGTTDPAQAVEFYNYLTGSWRDGSPFTFGDDAYQDGDPINYAFIGNPANATEWSMCNTQDPQTPRSDPNLDRRTIQASGPFRLEPGAVNELIIGVVWLADQLYPCPDVRSLRFADDISQALFDACFEITDGPDAPDVDFIELDQEIIAVFTNDTIISNNAFEEYAQRGLQIPGLEPDSLYRFEGYKLYQLSGPDVTLADVEDPDKAQLIFQVDINNGVGKIFNWVDVESPLEETYYAPTLRVEGEDGGIRRTFRITEDRFAQGSDSRLVNHRKYYFTAIAYAYNNYLEYDPTNDEGQRSPYLEGRRNIGDGENPFYTVIPRPIVYETLNSDFGDGVQITRVDGEGAGGNFLDITDETRQAIIDGSFDGTITYKPNAAPIDVRIFNPLEVKDGNYTITFVDNDLGDDDLEDSGRWKLINEDSGEELFSEKTIATLNEQILGEFGFTVTIGQTEDVGDPTNNRNGAIGYEEEYLDSTQGAWLTGIANRNPLPFVEGGAGFLPPQWFEFADTDSGGEDEALDPDQALTNIGTGYFFPYKLADYRERTSDGDGIGYLSPAYDGVAARNVQSGMDLFEVNNVDIVFTSDKSLWSRCVIVETFNDYDDNFIGVESEGNANSFDLREAPSVGKEDANGDGLPDPDGDGNGMGWFPGYAIDVETGQRLNIFFGENSMYRDGITVPGGTTISSTANPEFSTGGDMMYNPTSGAIIPTDIVQPFNRYNLAFGGRHYIYVTLQPYDECAALRERLTDALPFRRARGIQDVTWTAMTYLLPGQEMLSYADGLIPNDLIVKIRVDNPYQVAEGTSTFNGYPSYTFSLEGVAPEEVTPATADPALDMINVVPNPYYGYSAYETSQFSKIVKISNLPAECVVSIYSLDGKFIRQYNRNETGIEPGPRSSNRAIQRKQIVPDLEWDLENSKGVPVASGVYLIHIDAGELGERVIKWFGVARQFDPSGL
ncbi:MAG: hypothetical protein AAF849_07680 [Bacteroidota bacterium]